MLTEGGLLKVKVQATGIGKIDFEIFDGATVEDLLDQLYAEHSCSLSNLINPKTGKPYSFVNVWVNSVSIRELAGFETKLRERDMLIIFRPSAGG
jgi:molybdopterin converting factor small subunit